MIRISLVPSLPPYTGSRIRELSEIENDLKNLFFHVQVLLVDPKPSSSSGKLPAGSYGCRFSNVLPSVDKGLVTLAASDCYNVYQVYLATAGNNQSVEEQISQAPQVADSIKTHSINRVSRLVGAMQFSQTGEFYNFDILRKE